MRRLALLLVAAASVSGGCASLTNPVADAVPINRLPAEVLGRSKADLHPVPLTLLRQSEVTEYRLDKNDVLAIVAEEVLGPANVAPPVRLPDPLNPTTAAIGYPIPVNDDGTITLPQLKPIQVRGKTLAEVRELIIKAMTGGDKEIVKADAARVTVQIHQKRQYQILVVREDSGGIPFQGQAGQPVYGVTKKGAGFTIALKAGENDVLRALNATGGPPGLDAKNEVTILRGGFDPAKPAVPDTTARSRAEKIRIPLRVYPDQPLTIREEDIILKEGDVVLIESRDTEVYYTAGLLGAGETVLPRDRDLDVIQAIAQVRGPLLNGSFTQNAFVANSVASGVGNPNPSLCVVLRQLPDKRQIPIRVDLNRAFIDPRERLLIQPGDVIVLQERPGEAITRYLTQTIRINTAVETIRSGSFTQSVTGNNP